MNRRRRRCLEEPIQRPSVVYLFNWQIAVGGNVLFAAQQFRDRLLLACLLRRLHHLQPEQFSISDAVSPGGGDDDDEDHAVLPRRTL